MLWSRSVCVPLPLDRMWSQRTSTSSNVFSRSRTSTPARSALWWWPTADVTTPLICCWTTRLSLRLRSKKGGDSTTSPSCLIWGPLAARTRTLRMRSSRRRRDAPDSLMAVTLSPPSQAWITSCRSVRPGAHVGDDVYTICQSASSFWLSES